MKRFNTKPWLCLGIFSYVILGKDHENDDLPWLWGPNLEKCTPLQIEQHPALEFTLVVGSLWWSPHMIAKGCSWWLCWYTPGQDQWLYRCFYFKNPHPHQIGICLSFFANYSIHPSYFMLQRMDSHVTRPMSPSPHFVSPLIQWRPSLCTLFFPRIFLVAFLASKHQRPVVSYPAILSPWDVDIHRNVACQNGSWVEACKSCLVNGIPSTLELTAFGFFKS